MLKPPDCGGFEATGDPNPSTHSPCTSPLFSYPRSPTSQSWNDLGYLSPAVYVSLKYTMFRLSAVALICDPNTWEGQELKAVLC